MIKLNQLEQFEELIGELRNKFVIVEGIKDEKVLKNFGLKNVFTIGGKDLSEIPYQIPHRREIVILTDFDKAGRKLASRLNHLLRAHKRAVNSRLRNQVMDFGKNRIEDFGLLYKRSLFTRRGDVNVKISSKFNKICGKSHDKSKWRCGKAGCYRRDLRPN